MSALAATAIVPKTSDWLPVASSRELGIGDVIVIRKKMFACVDGSERHGTWSRKRYEQSTKKRTEVQISGRIVASYVEKDGYLKGPVRVLEPTAVSMPTPGQAVPDYIRVQFHEGIKLHEKHFASYLVRRSMSRSPDPEATKEQRHKFMRDLLLQACGGDMRKLGQTVDPWRIPCLRLGEENAKYLTSAWGWDAIREFHIRQCDGRMEIPRPWGETWSPPVKESKPFDHRLIPDDDGPPSPPPPPRRVRTPEELELDRQRRARLIAEAEADPDVAALLAALPGCKVREVRLRWEPEPEPLVDLVEDVQQDKPKVADLNELVDLEDQGDPSSPYADPGPAETDEQEHVQNDPD